MIEKCQNKANSLGALAVDRLRLATDQGGIEAENKADFRPSGDHKKVQEVQEESISSS